jgi:hypothetical protein
MEKLKLEMLLLSQGELIMQTLMEEALVVVEERV